MKISRISGGFYLLENSVSVPLPVSGTFEFFQDPRNLDEITPPFLNFSPENSDEAAQMREGLEITYKMRLHLFPVSWTSRISRWNPPHGFVDEQIKGPFAFWRHSHTFTAEGENSTLVEDRVDYKIPFGFAGRFANFLFVKRDLERIFFYRNERILEIVAGG